MNQARRVMMLQALCGAGLWGLRSLATGIPVAVLANPERARAEGEETGEATPQYLILATSQAGDPFNCNAPGTYLDPKIAHPSDPRLAKVSVEIGGKAWEAATPWRDLSAAFPRLSLIHHSTNTEQHLHQPDVMQLMGTVAKKDMAISAFAADLSSRLGTIQPAPVTLGTVDSSEAIAYQGRPQPMLNPMSLSDVLGRPEGVLGDLQALRDADLNRLNALFKEQGTPGQRAFLDRYATSQQQARKLSLDLLAQLNDIEDNGPDSQIRAAIVLIQMKVAPVITVHVPFGGDNHFDGPLQKEADESVTGFASLKGLIAALETAKLSDQVTCASLNVFGRTLLMQGAGRSHNRNHHLFAMWGKHVKAGVLGGVQPMGEDYGAMRLDSTTGAGSSDGDIPPVESLASVGKTLGVALGLSRERVDELIRFPSTNAAIGKVIGAAVNV